MKMSVTQATLMPSDEIAPNQTLDASLNAAKGLGKHRIAARNVAGIP